MRWVRTLVFVAAAIACMALGAALYALVDRPDPPEVTPIELQRINPSQASQKGKRTATRRRVGGRVRRRTDERGTERRPATQGGSTPARTTGSQGRVVEGARPVRPAPPRAGGGSDDDDFGDDSEDDSGDDSGESDSDDDGDD